MWGGLLREGGKGEGRRSWEPAATGREKLNGFVFFNGRLDYVLAQNMMNCFKGIGKKRKSLRIG